MSNSSRNRPDTDTEVVLEGIDYPLIEPGQYEAYLVSYETSTRFAKKVPEDNTYMKGGKIYMHFRIDPVNNAGLGNQEIIVFMSFNAKTIKKPYGKNGKFIAARRGKYGKLMLRFFSDRGVYRINAKCSERQTLYCECENG